MSGGRGAITSGSPRFQRPVTDGNTGRVAPSVPHQPGCGGYGEVPMGGCCGCCDDMERGERTQRSPGGNAAENGSQLLREHSPSFLPVSVTACMNPTWRGSPSNWETLREAMVGLRPCGRRELRPVPFGDTAGEDSEPPEDAASCVRLQERGRASSCALVALGATRLQLLVSSAPTVPLAPAPATSAPVPTSLFGLFVFPPDVTRDKDLDLCVPSRHHAGQGP